MKRAMLINRDTGEPRGISDFIEYVHFIVLDIKQQ
jgi:hypothetical protein